MVSDCVGHMGWRGGSAWASWLQLGGPGLMVWVVDVGTMQPVACVAVLDACIATCAFALRREPVFCRAVNSFGCQPCDRNGPNSVVKPVCLSAHHGHTSS